MSAAPGWYPEEGTTNLRWWDGGQWTEHRHPVAATEGTASVLTSDGAGAAAQQFAQAPQRPVVQSKPIERLNKREARGLADQLVADKARLQDEVMRLRDEAARLQGVVDRHGLRKFEEIDEYRAQAEATLFTRRGEVDAAMAAREAEANRQLSAATNRLAELQLDEERLRGWLATAQSQYIDLTAAIELQDAGLFDVENPANNSATLSTELEIVRTEIKRRISEKSAVSMAQRFLFNNSEAEGRKFMADMAKVLLRAYNAEAENAIKTTRAGNLRVAQERLTRAAEQIAKGGKMIDLRVEPTFHKLRLREIEIASRHLQAVARERELERERKAELREQMKAEAELRKAKESLEKEKAHFAAALAALEAKGDSEGADRMREKLADVDRAIDDVDYRAANIRAGYVYVISNVGAFGERMVKIGMTRRLEPMDRVNELGDASVPFRFDVHALFFANDAVGIEAMLHRTFAAERVNKVNLRREFFYVTPEQVLGALQEHSVEVIEYSVEPEAPEFRASAVAPEAAKPSAPPAPTLA